VTKPRIGPRMRELADFVSAVPGCNMAQALRGVGLSDRDPGAHRPVARALAAGLILAEQPGGPCRPYRLWASERDREMGRLRAELLHASPSAERAEEIAAEIAELRRQQAAEYAQAHGGGAAQ
jgi:hypothetical protein